MSDRPRQWNSTIKARTSPLKRGKPAKARRTPKRFAHRRDPAYAAWIRTLPCWVAVGSGDQPEALEMVVHLCAGRTECAHVKARGAGGDDQGNTVPLCTRHHRIQHAIGIQSFESMYALDLAALAERLASRYPAPDQP